MTDWGDASHNADWCQRVLDRCREAGVAFRDLDALVDDYVNQRSAEDVADEIIEEYTS